MLIEEKIEINRNSDDVYSVFKDPYRWVDALPDVSDVKVIYNDGRHQEFVMTVEKPHGAESARVFRYCLVNKILVYQPEPPPKMQKVHAAWHFLENGGNTVVSASRNIQLNEISNEENMSPEQTIEMDSFKKIIMEHLKRNLLTFKEFLET